MLAIVCIAITTAAHAEGTAEGLKRLDFIVGEWRGTSRGEPGEGTIEKSCTRALNGRYIECRTTVTYKKEVHVEHAFYSYDKAAKKLRLRQFHGEGFVNTYIETEPLVFVTSDIENIPAGWRARDLRTEIARRVDGTFRPRATGERVRVVYVECPRTVEVGLQPFTVRFGGTRRNRCVDVPARAVERETST